MYAPAGALTHSLLLACLTSKAFNHLAPLYSMTVPLSWAPSLGQLSLDATRDELSGEDRQNIPVQPRLDFLRV